MNNTTARVGLALLVVAVVVGIVWFFNKPDEPEQKPVAAGVESPGGKQEKTPQPAPTPDPAQEPAEVNPPVKTPPRPGEVERLFQALETAAEVRDIEGANEARKRLAAIGNEEVHDRATALLEKARNDAELSRWARRILIANTLYLVALGDADSALSWLIERWSEPRLSEEGRADQWTKHDRSSVKYFAANVLVDEDKQETTPLGHILTWVGTPGEAVPGRLIKALKARYAAEIPEGERPDPWLSGVFQNIVWGTIELQDSSVSPLRELLVVLRDNEALSARLRAQLAIYLVTAPRTIHDLLDEISRAESIRVAAEALRKYMQTFMLTENDVDLLVAAVHQKFGEVLNGPVELLFFITSDGGQGITLDNFQMLAGTLLKMTAEDSRDPAHVFTMLEMLGGLDQGWWFVAQRVGASDGATPMLDEWQVPETRQTLIRTFGRVSVFGGDSRQDMAELRVMSLIWRSSLTLNDKLEATIEIMTEHGVSRWVAGSIINGFQSHRGLFNPSLAEPTVRCLDMLFTKWKDPEPIQEQRPYKADSKAITFISKLAQALQDCGYPRLPDRLWQKLRPVVAGLVEDSTDWPNQRTRLHYKPHLENIKGVHEAYSVD
jgi:hypothetical protein